MADNLLSARDNAVIYLAAQGKPNSEIAEALGCSAATITSLLKQERIQFEIKRTQFRLFGKDQKEVQKRFDSLVPSAVAAIENILNNPNGNPKLQFSAAQEALDRSIGKPKQSIEMGGSLIKDIFDRLDSMKDSKQVIDIEPTESYAIDSPALPAEPKEESGDIDSWIKRNL